MKKRYIAGLILAFLFIVSIFCFDLMLYIVRPIFHDKIVREYSSLYNVDPLFVISVIKTESNFFKKARSHKGAIGLMQIMPATAQEMAAELNYSNFKIESLEEPRINIHIGVYYLSRLLKQFEDNKILALAAYNAGKNRVQDWYKLNPLLQIEIKDIPYDETRRYVKSVMRSYLWLKYMQEIKSLVKKAMMPY